VAKRERDDAGEGGIVRCVCVKEEKREGAKGKGRGKETAECVGKERRG
jgi:hypothetical protein